MAEIRVEGLTKRYPGTLALDETSLTVEDGEFMVLLGPSRCGKTALLRMIAGLEAPDRGTIFLGGRDMTDVPPARRGVAMVFQSYALFPHLRVFDNVAFGLRMHRVPAEELRARVRNAAGLMEIHQVLDSYPSQLSGDQLQRVAVARALVMEPTVILMDEPLSALDPLTKLHMRAELKRLLQDVKTTTLYATHDQVEALTLGDRTAVMRSGRIVQVDAPLAVYDRPADVFVARFTGSPPMNLLRGRLGEGDVEVEGHRLEISGPDGFQPGDEVAIGVRAENIEMATERLEGGMEAEVTVVEHLGSHLLVTLILGGQQLKVAIPADVQVAARDRVWLRMYREDLRLLGPASEL
jgi:multiple sugar transport system ATP-binding protein